MSRRRPHAISVSTSPRRTTRSWRDPDNGDRQSPNAGRHLRPFDALTVVGLQDHVLVVGVSVEPVPNELEYRPERIVLMGLGPGHTRWRGLDRLDPSDDAAARPRGRAARDTRLRPRGHRRLLVRDGWRTPRSIAGHNAEHCRSGRADRGLRQLTDALRTQVRPTVAAAETSLPPQDPRQTPDGHWSRPEPGLISAGLRLRSPKADPAGRSHVQSRHPGAAIR